jgi:hypothetical protein
MTVVAGAKRLLTLLVALAGGTAAASLVLGLALGASATRAVAVGLYLTGCALLLGAFFAGNRGPFRVANEEGIVGLRVPRGLRTASAQEHSEAFELTLLLALAGLVLLTLGALVDSNARLL